MSDSEAHRALKLVPEDTPVQIRYNPTKPDRYFAFSLMGVMIGLLITVFTVFLGNQPYQLFFLLAGWSQAVRVKRAARPELTFEQVYT